jgi:hypothetical protein
MAAKTKSYHTEMSLESNEQTFERKKITNFSNLAGSLSHRKGNFKRADSQLL